MSQFQRRICMTIFGVLVSGFSVGMFNFSMFGMDPFQVLSHGMQLHIPLGFGTFYMLFNLALLVIDFFLDKKKIGIATFINLFLLGYVVEFSSWLWKSLISKPGIWVRIAFLLVAIVVICFGSALYFTGDLGVSTYDAIALTISEKKPWPFRFVRITTDVICTLIGFLLGARVGAGTVITAFFMGPLIEFFNRTVARPLRYGRAKVHGRANLPFDEQA
jgi:uncharacterized membrane protein YczE